MILVLRIFFEKVLYKIVDIPILNTQGKVNLDANQCYWLHYRNNSSKTIKYLYVTVSFYNAVGDCIGTEEYKCTGPCESGAVKHDTLDFFKYSQLHKNCKFKISEIDIEYMDGDFVENCEWEYDYNSSAYTDTSIKVMRVLIIVFGIIFVIGMCLLLSVSN